MIWNGIALFVAAMLGGALNSVAGGGTFITLPTLIFTGVPPVFANTTSTVALWPGAVASVGAYRKELVTQKRSLLLLGGTSLIGGILGAVLLLNTPEDLFEALLPYLLLIATLLFTFGGTIARTLRTRFGRTDSTASSTWRALVGVSLLQLIISIYGGYFGGGIGFLMLAMLTLLGMENIHTMNALKTVLASCINGVAVLTFIFSAAVLWPQAIVMIGGAIAGGYGGALLAQRLDPQLVRRFVIAVGFAMTIYFFLR